MAGQVTPYHTLPNCADHDGPRTALSPDGAARSGGQAQRGAVLGTAVDFPATKVLLLLASSTSASSDALELLTVALLSRFPLPISSALPERGRAGGRGAEQEEGEDRAAGLRGSGGRQLNVLPYDTWEGARRSKSGFTTRRRSRRREGSRAGGRGAHACVILWCIGENKHNMRCRRMLPACAEEAKTT